MFETRQEICVLILAQLFLPEVVLNWYALLFEIINGECVKLVIIYQNFTK